MKRFIVCGAPCAGKSTFVKENAARLDLIWDYDGIHSALSGLESHDHLNEIRPYVLAAREAIFNQLEAHESQNCFIISSSPKKSEIEQLAARFKAEVVFLEVSQEEAHNRADLAERDSGWHNFINNWFESVDYSAQDWRLKAMKRKTFRAPLELKANSDQGEFKAVFASLMVKDLDGDVTKPGAFKNQEVVIESWNHGYELPVGKGRIDFDDSKVWIEGRFILETSAGKDHYLMVKELGSIVEWSYTFDILEASKGDFEGERVQFLEALDVWGVAPVTRGAGIGTQTMSIKSGAKRALPRHETATSESEWDGPANEARVRSGENVDYYARVYAWQDEDGDPGVKSTYRFIHHEISAEGAPGAANVRACVTGIGVLNGARGGTTIPDSDRRGVWNHLASHLRDADIEPPELKSVENLGEAQKSKPRDLAITKMKLIEIKVRKYTGV